MNEVELKSIKFKVGDKEFELTPDEAKKFKTILDEMFGKEAVDRWYPCPYPVYPVLLPWTTPWNPYYKWYATGDTVPIDTPYYPLILACIH